MNLPEPQSELVIEADIKGGAYILRLAGDITRDSGNALLQWRAWESGLPAGTATLLLDFSKTAYINSAGIAALIRLFRMGSGGLYHCSCFGLHYHYEKLFRMVGLNKYLTVFPSEWAALDNCRPNPANSDVSPE